MIIWGGWGGYAGSRFFNDGGRYDPAGNSWTAVSTNGAPAARTEHTAVWTGREMIVWGGLESKDFNDTFSYTPQLVLYLYQRP